MDSCCENKAGELVQLRDKQSRVLYAVLAVNAAMFVVEFVAGWLIRSTALLGDSLDMLGDASVYALTLFVLHRGVRARAAAALVKGGFMLLFGAAVVTDAAYKLYVGEVPAANWMGLIGLLALIANGVCFFLLYAHRSDDLNMRSTWLCSRNDLVANASVIAAAVLVAFTGSLWPDVVVGVAIAVLFLHSAVPVIREAWNEWQSPIEPVPDQASAPGASTSDTGTAPDCCATAAKGHVCAHGQAVPVAMPISLDTTKRKVSSCCSSDSPN